MRTAIVTDSTAYFTELELKDYDFTVVPLSINYSDENFFEGSKYTNKEFYHKLRTSKAFPTSSQPAAGEFVAAYTNLLKDFDHVLSIHLSGNLSGTVRSAQTAAELVDGKRITVVDSRSAAQGLAAMVIKACDLAAAGEVPENIIKVLGTMIANTHIFFLIDTLDYLHKGGRIGGAAALFGNLLQIKPILFVNQEGKVDISDKVRTVKKAEGRLIQLAAEQISKLGADKATIHVVHADAVDKALHLENLLKKELPDCRTIISELGPVIGMHVGPSTSGFIIIP